MKKTGRTYLFAEALAHGKSRVEAARLSHPRSASRDVEYLARLAYRGSRWRSTEKALKAIRDRAKANLELPAYAKGVQTTLREMTDDFAELQSPRDRIALLAMLHDWIQNTIPGWLPMDGIDPARMELLDALEP